METVIRCPRCKNKYVFFGSIKEVSYCPECLLRDEAEYNIVREYVRNNRGCSINEASLATNISAKKIITYLKEERLETVGNNYFLLCEICKQPINTGRYCQGCLKKANLTVISKVDKESDNKWRMDLK